MTAPWYDAGGVAIHVGHVLDVLAGLEAESVQCVVSSPPYWGLRAYGTEPQVWGGGDCEHDWETGWKAGITGGTNNAYADKLKIKGTENYKVVLGTEHATCTRCGAWRGELGSEPTIEMFVEHLVEVFRGVRRVLRNDGTIWLNLGSSFIGSTIESEEYVLRDDLTTEEQAYVYAELAKHLQAESEALSPVQPTDGLAERDVPTVLSEPHSATRELSDSGV